ncbi:MAG: FtsX-like permease family protein [Longimicrobiales bacterium]
MPKTRPALLLLASANVANLFLARATARQDEVAVRVALGAGRARIARQLLTESTLLTAAGAGLALVISLWSLEAVRVLAGGRVAGIQDATLDARVVAFMVVLALLVTLAFGLAPALQSGRVDLQTLMKSGARAGVGREARRTRELLVVAQVALAMVLLLGSGLLLRSYVELRGVDPGFTVEHVYAVPLEVTEAAYEEYWQVSVFFRSAAARIAALPGVVAAGAPTTEPFRDFRLVNDVTPVERAAEVGPAGYLSADWRSVTRGYFDAAQVSLLQGRLFAETDTYEAPRVAVINAALAEGLWPGGDAVGRSVFWGGTDGDRIQVIGVVGNVRDFALDEPAPPMLFLSAYQLVMPTMTMLVRTRGEVSGLASSIRSAIWALNPGVAVPSVQSVEQYRTDALARPRTQTTLLLCFALLALLVAAIGVYALVSYQVALRRRELGIRHALGAQPHALRILVLRRSALLIAAGLALGVLAALALGRFVRALLYETAPNDPLSFIALPALLALVAAYVPARRSATVDPLGVLRAD